MECVVGCIDFKLLLSVTSCCHRLNLSSLFKMKSLCYIILICTVCCATVFAGEMTFELPDSVKECFYEVIEKGTKCNLEYQVRKTFVFFSPQTTTGEGQAILHSHSPSPPAGLRPCSHLFRYAFRSRSSPVPLVRVAFTPGKIDWNGSGFRPVARSHLFRNATGTSSPVDTPHPHPQHTSFLG